MKETITLPAAINILYNKSCKNYQYRLIIYNSKLSKILHGKKERARLIEKEGSFFLIKDNSGNILSPFPKHQYLFMSIGKVLFRDLYPKSQEKSNTTRIKIKLYPNDWDLSYLDVFLETKEGSDLADKLMKLGYDVIPVTYHDKEKFESACADLVLYHYDNKIPIEITTTAPSKSEALRGINSPHGHQWTKVSGRITPLLAYSSENNLKSFIIINQKWQNYNHVKYLIDKLKNLNCYVLVSDFSDNWSNKIANKINELLC